MSERNYLIMKFETVDNEIYSIKLNNVRDDVEDNIAEIMSDIISANVLETEKGDLSRAVEAKLYEVYITNLDVE